MYVDETGKNLQSRINGHRADIIKDGQSLLYKHFRLPGHSAADMKIQILEKINHFTVCAICCNLDSRITPSTEDFQASTNRDGLYHGV